MAQQCAIVYNKLHNSNIVFQDNISFLKTWYLSLLTPINKYKNTIHIEEKRLNHTINNRPTGMRSCEIFPFTVPSKNIKLVE